MSISNNNNNNQNNVLNKLFYLLYFKFINPSQEDELDIKKVEEGVRVTVKRYKKTLEDLGKYDKGKLSYPKALSKHRSVRNYIQHLQK